MIKVYRPSGIASRIARTVTLAAASAVFMKMRSFTVGPSSPRAPLPMKTIGALIAMGKATRSTVKVTSPS